MKKKVCFTAVQRFGLLQIISAGLRLSVCLSLCFLIQACVETKEVEVGGPESPIGPKMDNVRFEVDNQPDLNPGNTLWLKRGEELVAKWDTYTLIHRSPGAMCSFESYTGPTPACWKCEYCPDDHTTPFCDRDPQAIIPRGTVTASPNIIFYNEFIATNEPTLLGSPSLYEGCPSSINFKFAPKGRKTIQMLAPELASYNPHPNDIKNRVALVDKKVFAIEPGLTETTIYKLKPHTDTNIMSIWYKFDDSIYLTDSGGRSVKAVWDDNFSKNLRVSKVRILKGKLCPDPANNGYKPCINPQTGRFILVDETPVIPRFITYFPNYIETNSAADGQTCYAQGTSDGGIDITMCDSDNNSATATDEYTVTPTYSEQNPTNFLTWFVAFAPGSAPSLAIDETLAIEFTIEVIP